MPKITIQSSGISYDYTVGGSLLDILLGLGIFVDNPCGGKGVCGKCRIKVLDGVVNEVTETEQRFLNPEEILDGIRLSCLVKPEQDLSIELLQKERKHKVLTSGYIPKFTYNIGVSKEVIEIRKASLEEQTPWEEQVEKLLGKRMSLKCLQTANVSYGVMTAIVRGDEIVQMEQGDTANSLYGVAIDIGTTTVVCTLVNMLNGEQIANASMINAQKHLGLDVLTRISYELEHPEDGVKKLQKVIVDSINEMMRDLCVQAAIHMEDIYEITIGANCTMMHMLLGVDATSIGKAPYAPMFVNAKNLKASEIGLQVAPCTNLYCLPSVSSYIGADIVAGAYVCELEKTKENILFIDIGTNGEIVLSKQGKILCCSCAAGPALEGMNISAGMRAAEGAIEEIEITEKGIQLKVIGEEAPIGLCGSGILSAVKELLRVGLVRKEGAFVKKNSISESDYRYPMLQMNGIKREFVLMDGEKKLLITQGDVRQVQLAKGAISSGVLALLEKAGITMEELDRVMIAGQFGSHLPADSLVGIGILPKEVRDKLVYVGNSSKTGAYMALMSQNVKKEMEELAGRMDYMELGATANYERLFSECLIFPQI